ncbi:MAG: DUF3108 domain-containing protein [Burkholderiaceae bacterium]
MRQLAMHLAPVGILLLSVLLHLSLLRVVPIWSWAATPPLRPLETFIVQLPTPAVAARPVNRPEKRAPRPPPTTPTPGSEDTASPLGTTATQNATPPLDPGDDMPADSPPQATNAESAPPAEQAHAAPSLPNAQSFSALPLPSTSVLYYDFFMNGETTPVAQSEQVLVLSANGNYVLSSQGKAVGLMSLFYSGLRVLQNSEGRFDGRGFHPERYIERRGNKPETQVRMDVTAGEIDFSAQGGQRTALPDGLQDRLTLAYQLGLIAREDNKNGRISGIGQVTEMFMASTRNIETLSFIFMGEQPLLFGDSEESTWYYRKTVTRPQAESQMEVWLSPKRHWLPVQMKVVDKNGLAFVQKLMIDKLEKWPKEIGQVDE